MGCNHSGGVPCGLFWRLPRIEDPRFGLDMVRPVGIVSVFAALCAVWVWAVPVYYVVTLDQAPVGRYARALVDTIQHVVPGPLGSSIFLLTQFVVIPLGLVLGLRMLWRRVHSRAWRGNVAGLAFGMWASTVLLVVPYLGTYPNIPPACIALLITGGPSAGSTYYLTVLAANAVIYPLLGALLALSVRQPNPPGACRRCAYDLTGNVSGVCPECGNRIPKQGEELAGARTK